QTNSSERERWGRVKQRLRAEVGDDVYSSWFTRIELDAIEDEVVRLSVPTRFLKSWIQAHYIERVLACWKAEEPTWRSIARARRTAGIPTNTRVKPERSGEAEHAAPVANGNRGEPRVTSAPTPAASDALGGSPLDPRLTFDAFVVGR